MAWYRCGMNATYNATTVSRSGAVCNYVSNVGGVPLSRFIANITPVQAGSGDPSPDNIRPITGWSAVNVARTGKNLFDKTKGTTGKYLNGNGYEINSNSYSITDYIEVKGGANITISGESTGGSAPCICYYDKNKTLLRAESHSGFSIPHTYTVPSNAYYFRESYESASKDTFQIEYGNSASAYSSYVTGQTATINLGDTYYGGYLNVSTGLLTITYGIVDLGSLTWKKQSDAIGDYFRSGKPTNMAYIPSGVVPNAICELYTVVTSSNVQNKNIAFSVGSSGYTFVRDTSYTDAQTFKTAMDGVHLVYELATPQTVQLTPAQLTQLIGENNVWADSGDSEVDFFKIIRT